MHVTTAQYGETAHQEYSCIVNIFRIFYTAYVSQAPTDPSPFFLNYRMPILKIHQSLPFLSSYTLILFIPNYQESPN